MVAVTFKTLAEILSSYAFFPGVLIEEFNSFQVQGDFIIIIITRALKKLFVCPSSFVVLAGSVECRSRGCWGPSRRITLTNMNYANSVFALIP